MGIRSATQNTVQAAAKLVVEPIFEAGFDDAAYGYRPKRSAIDAIKRIDEALWLHRGNVKPLPGVIAALNRKLRGWANYFQHGSVLRTRQTLDRFVYDRVRGFLRRRNQVQTRGLRRYPREFVFGELGVVELNALPRSL